MNEIWNSLKEALKHRMVSPIYGVFALSWIAFHWEFVYTTFFVSEDKIMVSKLMLKNEYVRVFLFNPSELCSWLLWLAPFVSTYLFIWKFPGWITIPAHAQYQKNKAAMKIISLTEEKRVQEAEERLAKAAVKTALEEKKVVKVQREIEALDPLSVWDAEYSEFRESRFYPEFASVVTSLYEYEGYVSYGSHNLSSGVLAYLDSNGLITFSGDRRQIDLTDKGKYFLKKYTSKK